MVLDYTVALGMWMTLVLSISQSICSIGNVSIEYPEREGDVRENEREMEG